MKLTPLYASCAPAAFELVGSDLGMPGGLSIASQAVGIIVHAHTSIPWSSTPQLAAYAINEAHESGPGSRHDKTRAMSLSHLASLVLAASAVLSTSAT
jgi:hypothetical protein